MKNPPESGRSLNEDAQPPSHNYIYTGRDEAADRLVTELMLAGEALAAPLRQQAL